ncbi:hypothetical protein E2C01_018459 [Portunus trituberculatus]|uniref:Uncharacterized protein n=1 Tax=Portunus trituberculatus TaxID=210409 RepID=A0A5B7DUH9_PORTR|nr:hypothetical protein [Portunus trituberculatus]
MARQAHLGLHPNIPRHTLALSSRKTAGVHFLPVPDRRQTAGSRKKPYLTFKGNQPVGVLPSTLQLRCCLPFPRHS